MDLRIAIHNATLMGWAGQRFYQCRIDVPRKDSSFQIFSQLQAAKILTALDQLPKDQRNWLLYCYSALPIAHESVLEALRDEISLQSWKTPQKRKDALAVVLLAERRKTAFGGKTFSHRDISLILGTSEKHFMRLWWKKITYIMRLFNEWDLEAIDNLHRIMRL